MLADGLQVSSVYVAAGVDLARIPPLRSMLQTSRSAAPEVRGMIDDSAVIAPGLRPGYPGRVGSSVASLAAVGICDPDMLAALRPPPYTMRPSRVQSMPPEPVEAAGTRDRSGARAVAVRRHPQTGPGLVPHRHQRSSSRSGGDAPIAASSVVIRRRVPAGYARDQSWLLVFQRPPADSTASNTSVLESRSHTSFPRYRIARR